MKNTLTVGELLEFLQPYNENSVVKIFGENESIRSINENGQKYDGAVFIAGGVLVIEKV
jgi:hypothetical protein